MFSISGLRHLTHLLVMRFSLRMWAWQGVWRRELGPKTSKDHCVYDIGPGLCSLVLNATNVSHRFRRQNRSCSGLGLANSARKQEQRRQKNTQHVCNKQMPNQQIAYSMAGATAFLATRMRVWEGSGNTRGLKWVHPIFHAIDCSWATSYPVSLPPYA